MSCSCFYSRLDKFSSFLSERGNLISCLSKTVRYVPSGRLKDALAIKTIITKSKIQSAWVRGRGKVDFSLLSLVIYSCFEKGCWKNVHATIPKGNMGYDLYTVSDDFSCRTYFCCFLLALANTFSWPLVPILSNFFEEQ